METMNPSTLQIGPKKDVLCLGPSYEDHIGEASKYERGRFLSLIPSKAKEMDYDRSDREGKPGSMIGGDI